MRKLHDPRVDALAELRALSRVLLKASNGVLSGNTFTEPKFIAAQVSMPTTTLLSMDQQ